MKNRENDKNATFQVIIDIGWHDILAHMRVDQHRSMRSLVEEALAEYYDKVHPITQ